MKISTLNIDWAKTYLKKNKLKEIDEFLDNHNSDILILTEAVPLEIKSYPYLYSSKQIPSNVEFQGLNYTKYLNGQQAFRVSMYSRIQSTSAYTVKDPFTSICREFEIGEDHILIYATIVGTQFNKMPYAQTEMYNCISDCIRLSLISDNLCLAGDLNTSFLSHESKFQIAGIKSQKELSELCKSLNLDLTTGNIPENIDHILMSNQLVKKYRPEAHIFIEKNILSDHKGVEVRF